MHAFRNSTQRLRRLVWLTLWAWSFALLSGVVNACVLNLPERAMEGSSPSSRLEAVTHTRLADSVEARGPTGQDANAGSPHRQEQEHGSSSQDSCLKFCDDESSALAKSSAAGVDIGATLIDARLGRHLAVAATQADAGSMPEPPRAHGPPLVIRFLRLTL
jgi:hypothetical protein